MYTYVWEHIFSLCSTTAFLILTKLGLITHIVYNISIFTSISGGANAPLRGGGGVNIAGFDGTLSKMHCRMF